MKEWGVDMSYAKGGALADAPQPLASPREIYLLKRSKGKHGKNLGKNHMRNTFGHTNRFKAPQSRAYWPAIANNSLENRWQAIMGV